MMVDDPGLTTDVVERAAEAVHRAWVAEQMRQGTPAHTLETCPMWQEEYGDGECANPKPSAHHFNMVPWAELPEDAKEVNRVTARAVLAAVQTRVEGLLVAAGKVDAFEAQYPLEESGYDPDEYARGRAAYAAAVRLLFPCRRFCGAPGTAHAACTCLARGARQPGGIGGEDPVITAPRRFSSNHWHWWHRRRPRCQENDAA